MPSDHFCHMTSLGHNVLNNYPILVIHIALMISQCCVGDTLIVKARTGKESLTFCFPWLHDPEDLCLTLPSYLGQRNIPFTLKKEQNKQKLPYNRPLSCGIHFRKHELKMCLHFLSFLNTESVHAFSSKKIIIFWFKFQETLPEPMMIMAWSALL